MGWVVPGGEANPQGTKYRRFECAAELVASMLILLRISNPSRISNSCNPKTQIPKVRLLQSEQALSVSAPAEHIS